MSLTAAVVKELVAAGLSGDTLISACERIEAASAPAAEDARSPAAIRQARYRANKKTSPVTSQGITKRNGDVTASHKEGFPPHPLSEENPSPKENPLRGQKKRASRLPDDFRPDLDWAISQGLSRSQAEMQAAKFRDYWAAAKDGLKSDWPATWRNWVRSFMERSGISPPKVDAVADEKRWQTRLNHARLKHVWSTAEWGPAPGKPGCIVPGYLLSANDGNGWHEWENAA